MFDFSVLFLLKTRCICLCRYIITNNNKKVQKMSLKGKVKWFNEKKGFGFIEREDGKKDVFVHISAVQAAGLDYLDEGSTIHFDVEDGPKGPSAVNLKQE